MRVLVTGAAGFIGFHVAKGLLERGDEVEGVDNLNDYYDPRLKRDRLALIEAHPGFRFHQLDFAQREIDSIFEMAEIERVIHLGAQAGVRYSIDHPHVFGESNLIGFLNILECCRRHEIEHLVFASSSSAYGLNAQMPFSVHDNADHPVSLYAATKRANELMAHSYSHLYGLPVTGLRFFTVYGPWGRPDMATYSFTKKILAGEPIDVYNYGRMKRDFIYVDDIVEGVLKVADRAPAPDPSWPGDASPDAASSSAPYRVYNIGNHSPVELLYLIQVLEGHIGRKAVTNLLPLQPGDLVETFADVTELEREFGFKPSTPIEVGLGRFVEWYRQYHG